MPRRGNIAKRDVLADPILHNSKMVTCLVNSAAPGRQEGASLRRSFTRLSSMIQEKTGDPPETFEKAMEKHRAQPRVQDPSVLAVLTTRFLWKSALPTARLRACAG